MGLGLAKFAKGRACLEDRPSDDRERKRCDGEDDDNGNGGACPESNNEPKNDEEDNSIESMRERAKLWLARNGTFTKQLEAEGKNCQPPSEHEQKPGNGECNGSAAINDDGRKETPEQNDQSKENDDPQGDLPKQNKEEHMDLTGLTDSDGQEETKTEEEHWKPILGLGASHSLPQGVELERHTMKTAMSFNEVLSTPSLVHNKTGRKCEAPSRNLFIDGEDYTILTVMWPLKSKTNTSTRPRWLVGFTKSTSEPRRTVLCATELTRIQASLADNPETSLLPAFERTVRGLWNQTVALKSTKVKAKPVRKERRRSTRRKAKTTDSKTTSDGTHEQEEQESDDEGLLPPALHNLGGGGPPPPPPRPKPEPNTHRCVRNGTMCSKPVMLATIKECARTGHLLAEDQVCEKGWKSWRCCKDCTFLKLKRVETPPPIEQTSFAEGEFLAPVPLPTKVEHQAINWTHRQHKQQDEKKTERVERNDKERHFRAHTQRQPEMDTHQDTRKRPRHMQCTTQPEPSHQSDHRMERAAHLELQKKMWKRQAFDVACDLHEDREWMMKKRRLRDCL